MVKTKLYSLDVRDIVLRHKRNGKKPKQIVECLAGEVSKPNVYRWISEFNSSGILNKILVILF
jgi:transposase